MLDRITFSHPDDVAGHSINVCFHRFEAALVQRYDAAFDEALGDIDEAGADRGVTAALDDAVAAFRAALWYPENRSLPTLEYLLDACNTVRSFCSRVVDASYAYPDVDVLQNGLAEAYQLAVTLYRLPVDSLCLDTLPNAEIGTSGSVIRAYAFPHLFSAADSANLRKVSLLAIDLRKYCETVAVINGRRDGTGEEPNLAGWLSPADAERFSTLDDVLDAAYKDDGDKKRKAVKAVTFFLMVCVAALPQTKEVMQRTGREYIRRGSAQDQEA